MVNTGFDNLRSVSFKYELTTNRLMNIPLNHTKTTHYIRLLTVTSTVSNK